MQPTMKLRWHKFLAGTEYHPAGRLIGHTNECLVLQQWHEGVTHTAENGEVKEHVYGEWRDVPIEVES